MTFTLADIAKVVRVKTAKIRFAIKYCGLPVALPQGRAVRIYDAADVEAIREWFADGDNFRAVHGYRRHWAGHGCEAVAIR